MSTIEIHSLTEPQMAGPRLAEPQTADFMDAIHHERGDTAWQRVAGFIREVRDGSRSLWFAQHAGETVGMITLRWQSAYPGFRVDPIAPEIVDLYVWQSARRQGIATALLQCVEDVARAQGYRRLGLGVGILANDMPAWDLYRQHGYQFDGTGAWWNGAGVTEASHIDHAQAPVLLMMSKRL